MQEVQRTLDYKAELNLIEWVWHQENRVKEHTQVEAAFGYECTASWEANYHATNTERQSTTNQWTLTLWTTRGATEFRIKDGWIRIPLAWPYLVRISVIGWSSSGTVTNYIRVNDEVVYQQDTSSPSVTVTNDVVLNLWRYDIISFRWDMYYSWSSSSYTTNSTATINIKRL